MVIEAYLDKKEWQREEPKKSCWLKGMGTVVYTTQVAQQFTCKKEGKDK